MKVICCPVGPFKNQATASEDRRHLATPTVPPVRWHCPLALAALGGSIHESSKAGVRKEFSDRSHLWSMQNCCIY